MKYGASMTVPSFHWYDVQPLSPGGPPDACEQVIPPFACGRRSWKPISSRHWPNWHEAAEKARYLLDLFPGTLLQEDRRSQRLTAAAPDDFDRLADQA